MSAEIFTSEKNLAFDGVVKPVGWRRWSWWKRFDWIREQGWAADQLEAVEVLKEMGEWPEVVEFAPRGMSPELPEGVEVVRQSAPKGFGRRDALKGIY